MSPAELWEQNPQLHKINISDLDKRDDLLNFEKDLIRLFYKKPVNNRYQVQERRLAGPSRRWLNFKFEHDLWEKLVHLHGTSIADLSERGDLSDLDKKLIRRFGGYKNDKTKGQYRSTVTGDTIDSSEEESTEIQLFQP